MVYLRAFVAISLFATVLSENARVIGNSCTDNSECTLPNASCQDNICDCTMNFVPRADRSGCLPVVTTYLGACDESLQCRIFNVPETRQSCQNGVCVCHQSFTYRSGKCLGNAQLGEQCVDHRDCSITSNDDIKVVWCFNNVCSCRKGYIQKENRCVIGGNCENDFDCFGEANSGLSNSFCDKRKRDLFHCACKEGYVSAMNDTECLQQVAKLGESCTDTAQCIMNLGAAICQNNKCICAPHAEEVNGHCNGASALASISAAYILFFLMNRLIF